MFNNECSLEGYKASDLMKETAKIRQIITKRGTMEILIPLLFYKSSQIQGI
jgi:hypothetical protein